MTDVEIEYCVPCGLLGQAQHIQHELLETFGRDLDGVRLKTGEGGAFVVRVDGDVVYDKGHGEGFDMGDIEAEVRSRVTG